jgi:LPS-assembly protein
MAWLAAGRPVLAAPSDNVAAVASRCRTGPADTGKPAQNKVLLQADSLTYDAQQQVIAAEGHVEAAFYSCVLVADSVQYDEKNSIVHANGHIAIIEPSGNVVFADSLELSDGLEQGVVSAFSAILGRNTRIAAVSAIRKPGEITVLDHVVYSPCRVCNTPNFQPLWQIKALRVIHDERHKTITYKGAVMEVKGVPVLYLPYFKHSDPSVKRQSGLLIPSLGHSTDLGNNVEIPYYIDISRNQDVTVDPMITADAGTDFRVNYRLRTEQGQLSLDGSGVYVKVPSNDPANPTHDTIRSSLFGTGLFRYNDVWSYGFDSQLTSDDTYLYKYRISDLDRLTTRLYAEGFADRDYASISSYYFQGLRQQDNPATTPLILPLGELTWYPNVKALGGTVRVDGSVLSLTRSEDGDIQRLSITGTWQRQAITTTGHIFTLFGQSRGDLYYTSGVNPTNNPLLPADSAVTGRALPTIGAEWRWPLARSSANVYQVIEPIVQAVWSPYGGNPKNIPNEDSTSFEFDDTNLFSLNKLPGLDLVESGPRANVGVRYAIFGDRGEEMEFLFGENFRLKRDAVFDPTTGLGDKRSDYVGRIILAPNKYFELIHRFRIDKDNFSFNRNEVIARAGIDDYWARVSYLHLAPQLSTTGLKTDELEGETSLKIWGDWSFEGEARRDLANDKMITSGAALVFSNECIEIQFVYKRRFTREEDILPASSFNIRLRLKTFGENTSRRAEGEGEGILPVPQSNDELFGKLSQGSSSILGLPPTP